MFDDVKNQSAQPSGSGQNTGEGMSNPPASGFNPQGSPSGKIEDIFAETEKEAGFGAFSPAKPAIFQPVKPGAIEASSASGGLFSSPKIKLIGLIVLALIFVAGGTWYVYTSTLSQKNKDLNTASNDADTSNAVSESGNTEADNNNQNTEKPEQPVVPAPAEPAIKDADQDGLTDDEEKVLGMNINSNDTDSDGLFDREEVKTYLTDPISKDTDGDGYADGDEVKGGYNPKGAGKLFDINNSVK